MFVNQVLFRHENVASDFFYFLEYWNVVHYILIGKKPNL